MKILRYLLAIALAASLSGVARADDFQMVIIDPLPKPSEINFVLNQNFPVTLSACNADQLNGLSASLYLGCFTGLNDTGKPLTSIDVVVPVFYISPGVLDTPNCALPTGTLFSGCTYTSNGVDYFVNFTGGNIPTAPKVNGDCDNDNDGNGHGFNADDVACNAASIFTIAVGFGTPCETKKECKQETNAILADFNDNGGVVGIANTTPEPNSFLLMSTGVLSIGLFGACKRRQVSPLNRKL
jgi:hypothetical protein